MAEEGDSPVEALRTYQLFRLQKFAGGPTPNVEEFQREVSWALTMNPMPPNAACGYILNALEGPARRRVLMLPHDAVDTPKKILDVLVEAYGERKDVIDVIASFYNRRQRREESVDEYATTLRNLQAKANSLQSGAISNIHLAAQLVKGLKNCHVRRETSRHLADNESSSFADLLKTAKRVEREEEGNEDREDEIDRLTARVRQLEMETASQPHRIQQSNILSTRTARPAALVCYWCEREGHREADCQHKQRYLRRQQARQRDGQRFSPITNSFYRRGGGRRGVQAAAINNISEDSSPTGQEKLTVPVVCNRMTGKGGVAGLTGKCPTVEAEIQGIRVLALLDTGSEVTTVTDEWARGHMQNLQLNHLPITLRGTGGAEVPYSGVALVDIKVFDQCLKDIPILIVNDPVDAGTRERRRRVPLLLGMNVLDRIPDATADVPHAVQVAVREAHLERTVSTKGLARAAVNTYVPAFSMVTIKVTSVPYHRPLLAAPVAQPTPGSHWGMSLDFKQ